MWIKGLLRPPRPATVLRIGGLSARSTAVDTLDVGRRGRWGEEGAGEKLTMEVSPFSLGRRGEEGDWEKRAVGRRGRWEEVDDGGFPLLTLDDGREEDEEDDGEKGTMSTRSESMHHHQHGSNCAANLIVPMHLTD